MTLRLIAMRGASGSGKSTVARQLQEEDDSLVVVSRDQIRLALFGRPFGPGVDEDLVTKVETDAIRAALESGFSVISDNTNLTDRFLKRILAIGAEFGAELEIMPFRGIPVETLVERVKARAAAGGHDVPENVINRQATQAERVPKFPMPGPSPLLPIDDDPGLPEAVLVDIDGTLARMRDRGPFEWTKVYNDDPNYHLMSVLDGFKNNRTKVILLSGRDGEARPETERWLKNYGVHYDELYMREVGDSRPDTVFKAETFDRYIRGNYWVIGVWDDRPSVTRMWRDAGLPIYHVAPFNRDF